MGGRAGINSDRVNVITMFPMFDNMDTKVGVKTAVHLQSGEFVREVEVST